MTSVRFKRVEKCRRLLRILEVTLFGFEGAEALKLVLIVTRVHPFPFRTRKLSSFTPKILAWRRAGKIGNANTKETVVRLSLFLSCGEVGVLRWQQNSTSFLIICVFLGFLAPEKP